MYIIVLSHVTTDTPPPSSPSPSLRQVINNACATQAILSVLMNTDHPDVQLSSTLTELRDFTAGFDPATRGLALSNSDVIRTVHNSFARWVHGSRGM